ncbi:hypothetical protein [Alkalihalobacterium alkalinitrilicum]|uniref:hypothetical protein n=1 Tax=Alkalihalobacterium alkalinitrilicum TaxID=427920 RepID=UPI001C571C9C|nr:hypothetical protein [Alkalihalobacterium alkalinitrilicum]
MKTFFGWASAVIILILLVCIPREIGFEFYEYEIKPTYTFSIEHYYDNLKSYISMVFIEHTLGETRFGFCIF